MELWYAAYGSNMAADRFACYLAGGCPTRSHRGLARGARPHAASGDVRPVRLDGSVYFAWESPTWGGGIAFYDPDGLGRPSARYLLDLSQFSDVAAQEMHREPGTDLDLAELWDDRRAHAWDRGATSRCTSSVASTAFLS